MTDKTRSFKEEINHIHVPTEKLDAIISNTINEYEGKRKKLKGNKIVYSLTAVAAAFLLLVSTSSFSPAMANIVSKIPILGSVFSDSGDVGLKQVNQQGLSQLIGTSERVGETSMTLDEVFYDETRLTIGFSIVSENPIGDFYLASGPEITINGKAFSGASTYGEKELAPTHKTGIVDMDSVEDLPEAFTLGLIFTGADGKQWEFSTQVKKSEEVQNVVIDHQQKANGIDLKVSEVKVSPAGLLFSYSANYETDLGNGRIDFNVFDEKGNELSSHSGSAIVDHEKKQITGTILIDPIKDDVKKLTVTPYMIFPESGMGVEVDLQGNEATKTNIQPYEGPDIHFENFTVTIP
ncbi:DUF4179 domain-containing protein [Ureibacillus sp. Re31]|uniref:DUF4179 domain-containing protein n=1 Tax=Ureibacillus galli TaxID=2762222 RepID=A0ABR8XFN4_9BACL|nr:DUF4179 domain-containing protein [Ureibacillus galli]MBD8028047.1 DUF4179 domain-containing protein [Ureibacillus galli]